MTNQDSVRKVEVNMPFVSLLHPKLHWSSDTNDECVHILFNHCIPFVETVSTEAMSLSGLIVQGGNSNSGKKEEEEKRIPQIPLAEEHL